MKKNLSLYKLTQLVKNVLHGGQHVAHHSSRGLPITNRYFVIEKKFLVSKNRYLGRLERSSISTASTHAQSTFFISESACPLFTTWSEVKGTLA